jgi:hypothetical protein
MSIFEKIRLIGEWSPLLSFDQRIGQAKDAHAQTLVVVEACKWLATKTDTTADDNLVAALQAMLLTPQGEAFIRACIDEVAKIGVPS